MFKLFYKTFNIFRSLITETVTETSDGKVIGSMTSLPTGGNLPVVTLRVDTKYPIRFLVDTGAARSLMRKEYAALFPLDKTETGELVAANNTAIDVLGTTNLNVQIAEKLYPFSFVLADTTSNILGFDFIKRYGVALITDETGFYMKPTKGGLNMHELCANTNSVMLLPTFDHNHEVIYQAVTQPHLKDGMRKFLSKGSNFPVAGNANIKLCHENDMTTYLFNQNDPRILDVKDERIQPSGEVVALVSSAEKQEEV